MTERDTRNLDYGSNGKLSGENKLRLERCMRQPL